MAKFGTNASGILFSWRDNSSYRLYILGPLCLWQCFTFILSLRPRPPYQGSPPVSSFFRVDSQHGNFPRLVICIFPTSAVGQILGQNIPQIQISRRIPPGSWPIYRRMEVDSATVRGPWVITWKMRSQEKNQKKLLRKIRRFFRKK